MQYVLCNLASYSFLAFSLSITRFAKYVVSGFAVLYGGVHSVKNTTINIWLNDGVY